MTNYLNDRCVLRLCAERPRTRYEIAHHCGHVALWFATSALIRRGALAFDLHSHTYETTPLGRLVLES